MREQAAEVEQQVTRVSQQRQFEKVALQSAAHRAEQNQRAQLTELEAIKAATLESQDTTRQVQAATLDVQAATLEVAAAVRAMDAATTRLMHVSIKVAIGVGLGGAVVGAFIGAIASRAFAG